MPSITSLTRSRPTKARIDFGDGDFVELVFDRNKITPAWTEASRLRDSKQDELSLAKAIADVLVDWDVTDNEGAPFPPTAENVGCLSYPAQKDLIQQMLEAAVPSDAEGKTSAEPSPAATSVSSPPEPTHQNGQETSPSPEHSASPSLT